MAQGRVECDAGAEQRRGRFQVEFVGKVEDEIFRHDNEVGIAAVSRLAILLDAVVGRDHSLLAILFQTFGAARAILTGIDQTTDRGEVALPELGHVLAHRGDAADDFVAGDHRVSAVAPIVARLMKIGMANAGIKNFDPHIARPQGPALEGEWRQRSGRALGGVTGCLSGQAGSRFGGRGI